MDRNATRLTGQYLDTGATTHTFRVNVPRRTTRSRNVPSTPTPTAQVPSDPTSGDGAPRRRNTRNRRGGRGLAQNVTTSPTTTRDDSIPDPPAPSTPIRNAPTLRSVRFNDSPGEEFDFSQISPETPPRNTPAQPGPTTTPSTPFTPRRLNYRPATPRSIRRVAAARPASIPLPAFIAARRERQRSGTKRGAKADDVDAFFIPHEDDKLACKLCQANRDAGEDVPFHIYRKTTSTDARRKHLCKSHGDTWVQACRQMGIAITAKSAIPTVEAYLRHHPNAGTDTFFTTPPPSSGARPEFSQEAFVDAIMVFIVSDDQSINVVENKAFRDLILLLRSELKDQDIPHIDSMRARILETLDEYLDKLATEMKNSEGKISFTLDLWTDHLQRSFLAVTAHWVEATTVSTINGPQRKLVLRADLIAFRCIPVSHTGEHIGEAFIFTTDRLGITSLIGYITMDNASNNDTFMESIAETLHRRFHADLGFAFDPVQRRIRCFAHTVNLACQDAIAELERLHNNLVGRLRSLIVAIRASSSRRARFLTLVKRLLEKELQIILDSKIRWSSTYYMIERAILLRRALEDFLKLSDYTTLANLSLSSHEWEFLQHMKDILQVPHAFQERLSADKTPTLCDAIPAFEAMLAAWEALRRKYPSLASAVGAGIRKLNDYANRTAAVDAYLLAMVINPRMKLMYYEKFMPTQLGEAKETFISAVNEASTESTTDVEASGATADDALDWAHQILGLAGAPPPSNPQTISAKQEVENYLADTTTASSSLLYWQENRARYPRIYRVAMDILPVQGTSVSSERVFSSSKQTITDRRSRLSVEMMEALQILKFAIKRHGGLSLDFTATLSAEEQLAAAEMYNSELEAVPEDLGDFVESLNRIEDFIDIQLPARR